MKQRYMALIMTLLFSAAMINALIYLFPKHSMLFTALSIQASAPSVSAAIPYQKPSSDLFALSFSQSVAAWGGKSEATPPSLPGATESAASSSSNYSEPLPSNITETTVTKGRQNLFGIEINNETAYDITDAFSFTPPTVQPDGPTVLILHTHTSESYRPSEGFMYTPSDNDRTEDLSFNVARVGAELCSELNRLGVFAIHDPTVCDYPSYNGSYKKMLSVAEAVLHKYPSVQIVIDLHRDAMITSEGTKISTVTSINGEKAAQIMLVVGTDANGLYHPEWQKNLSFAVRLQQIMDEKYPSLARPLNLRCERFNGHLCPNEIIMEVGTNGNTLPEALASARAAASSIAALIQDS